MAEGHAIDSRLYGLLKYWLHGRSLTLLQFSEFSVTTDFRHAAYSTDLNVENI